MAELKLKGICKKYSDGYEAVKDFNLDIKDGEFVVFVGPSGCGKSTTLRMIAGLEEISGGELYIDNEVVNDKLPKDRDIAMVFQSYALYPHMNVYDNMAFALKLRKVSKEEIDEKVRSAAKILDIEHLLERKPKALSGGQRQRVAMGRAIVRKPKVFLMDEPLSNLDAKLRVQMRAEISKLHNELDTTFIYVTHDQTEAMTLGSRIVVMKDGVVQQVATPKEIYNKPNNVFVATFIGSPQMNLLYGNSSSDDNVLVSGVKLRLSDQQSKSLKNKKINEVIVGIRPEDMMITKFGVEGSIGGTVEIVEYLGCEAIVHVKIEERTIAIKLGDTTGLAIGDKVGVILNSEKIHVFDKKEQQNILA